jgi:HD-GYP domain-containing protein (c-di-GMP phosphodiesterase class II)
MAQDRVYRSKLSDEDIINQLENGMGKQFNPKVAEEMISYIKEGLLS